MPAHSHNFAYGSNEYPAFSYAKVGDYQGGLRFFVGKESFGAISIAASGGGGSHNNVQPSRVALAVIKT